MVETHTKNHSYRADIYIVVLLFLIICLSWTIFFEKILGITAPDFLYAFMSIYLLATLLLKLSLASSSYIATAFFFCIPIAVMNNRPDIAHYSSLAGFLIAIYILITLFFHIRRSNET